jgi:hypothetical protein
MNDTTVKLVKVTLRPTVSRPVRLGVLPLLEQVTRCYIYLGDNDFLYFSCRAPSLMRGRVCNLQCNEASSISSYIVTNGLSASSSWCWAPFDFNFFVWQLLQCCHWEGCMGSMQCNVEFGYQLSICSGTKENHGHPWSSWDLLDANWLN